MDKMAFAQDFECPMFDGRLGGEAGGTAFEMYFYITDRCVPKAQTLGIGWAITIYGCIAVRSTA